MSVARNPTVPVDLAVRLSRPPQVAVRREIVVNPATPLPTVRWLAPREESGAVLQELFLRLSPDEHQPIVDRIMGLPPVGSPHSPLHITLRHV